MENGNALEAVGAGLIARPTASEAGKAEGRFFVECLDENGNLKWADHIDNLIVDTGKNAMLDNVLNTTATASTNIFMGLVNGGSAPTYAAADTMASHAGWTELNITSSSGARQTPSFSAASAGAKATSSNVAFSVTSSGTVAGVFVAIGSTAVATNGSTAGTLFSAGSFSGGNRAVVNGDTLNVSYSVSI